MAEPVPTGSDASAVLRAEAAGTPPLGHELRVSPTRRTKDGSFLAGMVDDGLLSVAGKPEPPGGRDRPEPFRVRYKLTALGRHAAEYGEYDRPHTPAERPLSGLAAELEQARKPWARGRGKRA